MHIITDSFRGHVINAFAYGFEYPPRGGSRRDSGIVTAMTQVGKLLADKLGVDVDDERLPDVIMALVSGASYGRVDVEGAWDDPLDLRLTLL